MWVVLFLPLRSQNRITIEIGFIGPPTHFLSLNVHILYREVCFYNYLACDAMSLFLR